MRQGNEEILAIEEAFDLPPGFVVSLKDENDWSLIIKSHALIESACSEMLCHHFGKYELTDIFSNLEMSNKKCGKIAFISALGLLSKAERKFISELSELRNLIVHNASNVTFSLKDHLNGLSIEKRKKTISALNIRLESISIQGKVMTPDNISLERPSLVIWTSLLTCLLSIYAQDVFGIKRNEMIGKFIEEAKKNGPIFIQRQDLPKSISARKK